jgi:hypothetical protein
MRSKLLFTFILLLILFNFSYALTAHKNSLRAAPDNGHEIGGEAARMVFDEQANAVRVMIDGHERFRIDAKGAHVDGGFFHMDTATHADDTGGGTIDIVSNGFKMRDTVAGLNGSGGTFVYIAFAEHPFGGAGVSPANAR